MLRSHERNIHSESLPASKKGEDPSETLAAENWTFHKDFQEVVTEAEKNWGTIPLMFVLTGSRQQRVINILSFWNKSFFIVFIIEL